MSILWNFDKYAKIEALPFDPSCINENDLIPISGVELLLKAGTPLALYTDAGGGDEGGGDERGSVKGAVKKGDTKTAETPSYTLGTVHPYSTEDAPTCFAAEDYHFILTNAQQPKLVKCVTKGYIEKAKVLAAADLESVPDGWADALAALGLYLVDELGALPGGGSSGGGGSRTVWYGVAAQSSSDIGEVYKNAAHTETVSADELSAAFSKGLVIAAADGPMTLDMLAVGIIYSGSDLMGVYCISPSGDAFSFGPSDLPPDVIG